MRLYFTSYGVPNRLISDRGSAFTSYEFKQFMDESSSNHILVAIACPRANGQVERINRFLTPILSKMIDSDKEWDQVLVDVEFVINNTISRAIGTTPFRVLYGVDQR